MVMRNRNQSDWRQILWQAPLIIFMAGLVALCANSLRSDSLPLVGDWSVKADTSEGGASENIVIPVEGAEKLFSAGLVLFIDARDPEDYADCHIKGALSLPLSDVETRFPEIAGGLPTDKISVTYCDGEGCHMGHDLALFLREKGFSNAWELVNGMTVWLNAGLPVEEGSEV